MRILALVGICALLAAAQDKTVKTGEAAKPKALPKGQTRVLEAIVMSVQGVAQSRAAPKEKWAKLAVNDVLKPGAVVRTGRKSEVALRVGMNASMRIGRQTRVAIPEIIQDGDVLRTRVKLTFGKAEVRVDRIGLRNDFGVATPTATMAVRGTTTLCGFNATEGSTFRGVPGNTLRSVEITWLDGVAVFLTADDGSSEGQQMPAVFAFMERYVTPLQGAIGSGEAQIEPGQDVTVQKNPAGDTGLQSQKQNQGGRKTNPGGSRGGGNTTPGGGGEPIPVPLQGNRDK